MDSIEILKIKLKPRVRKDFGNLQSLSDSIKRLGVIQPVVLEEVEGTYTLIAGERRLRASIGAGLKTIPYVLRTGLNERDRKELELEENLHRKDLSWPEEAELKLQIDELSRERMGSAMSGSSSKDGWSLEKLSDKLDESTATTSRDLKLARFLRENPQEKEAMTKLPKTVALRKILRKEEVSKLRKLNLKESEADKVIILGDAIELMKKIPSNSIDLILTDPPYGTEAVGTTGGKLSSQGKLDNMSYMEVLDLLKGFTREASRILKPGRHIYVFFALEYYSTLRACLEGNHFFLNRYPIIWFKGQPMTAFTGMNYTRSWESMLFGIKDMKEVDKIRPLANPLMDLIQVKPIPPLKRLHVFEKPQELLETLIKQSTEENELILDPFAGSGSTLLAAKTLHRQTLGFELNPDNYELIKKRLEK